jgi:hypothetical protein
MSSRPSYDCAEGSPTFSEMILILGMVPSFAKIGESARHALR